MNPVDPVLERELGLLQARASRRILGLVRSRGLRLPVEHDPDADAGVRP